MIQNRSFGTAVIYSVSTTKSNNPLHIDGTKVLESCTSEKRGNEFIGGSSAISSRFIIICDGSSRDHKGPGPGLIARSGSQSDKISNVVTQ